MSVNVCGISSMLFAIAEYESLSPLSMLIDISLSKAIISRSARLDFNLQTFSC